MEVGRLGTTDEDGKRVYIYQPDFDGKYKRFRQKFYYFLIAIYLIVPWIHIGGEQIIRLDIKNRVFNFFGHKLLAHDAPMLSFLLLGFAFTLAFVTARWGRVWCGFACPQTVFIEAIYRRIERLVEGSFRKRRELDRGGLSFKKIGIKSLKWFLFLLVSLHIVHSFLGYFVGTHELVAISLKSPSENWTLFIIMSVMTAIIMFDFGWFREQFCIIACPYGRIQSVLMDEQSMVVGYDHKRGEPRRAEGVAADKEGDCIDCDHCVKVCPTGIDIRQGTQLECIACTACIDACDNIMDKVNRPKGLIAWTSEAKIERKPVKKFSIRQGIYLVALSLILGFFVYKLNHIDDLNLVFSRPSSPYKVTGDNVFSFYSMRFERKGNQERTYRLKAVELGSKTPVIIKTQKNPFTVKTSIYNNVIFFQTPKSKFKDGKLPIVFLIEEKINGKFRLIKEMELFLAGPY